MEAKEKIESFLKGVKIWSFNVKFNTTDPNIKTFEEFKLFCKKETNDNYLQGIKYLMDFYEKDYKYNSLYDLIELLQVKVISIQRELDKLKSTNNNNEMEEKPMFKTFGE